MKQAGRQAGLRCWHRACKGGQAGRQAGPNAGEVHASAGEVHASAGEVHASAGEVHASAGQVHASAGQVHASAGQVHASEASEARQAGRPKRRSSAVPALEPRPHSSRPMAAVILFGHSAAGRASPLTMHAVTPFRAQCFRHAFLGIVLLSHLFGHSAAGRALPLTMHAVTPYRAQCCRQSLASHHACHHAFLGIVLPSCLFGHSASVMPFWA